MEFAGLDRVFSTFYQVACEPNRHPARARAPVPDLNRSDMPMSGPIVRKYGFPNFDKIFGERKLEHGVDEPEKAR